MIVNKKQGFMLKLLHNICVILSIYKKAFLVFIIDFIQISEKSTNTFKFINLKQSTMLFFFKKTDSHKVLEAKYNLNNLNIKPKLLRKFWLKNLII